MRQNLKVKQIISTALLDKMSNNITKNTFKSILQKQQFWDIDFEQLDVDENKAYVIERILDRANSWHQLKAMIAYYGKENLTTVIKNIRYLNSKTINFCSIYFDIPLTEMRCYTLTQSMPKYWNY